MDKLINLACGATVTPLRRITNPKGDIYHGIKASEESFKGFGEAYFSTVLHGETKGWKLHHEMTLNLIVPVGLINFYLRTESGEISEQVSLGDLNYARLTVPPGIWMAFKGIGNGLNMLLNVASIQHNPAEAITVPLDRYPLEVLG